VLLILSAKYTPTATTAIQNKSRRNPFKFCLLILAIFVFYIKKVVAISCYQKHRPHHLAHPMPRAKFHISL
jgi:hypothetical protein